MPILTDAEILRRITYEQIIIEPFRRECLGSNSYDVHLGKTVAWYAYDSYEPAGVGLPGHLDAKKQHEVQYHDIQPEGFVLWPGELYLAVTEEYTETHRHVPALDGKSSIGRLGIAIHVTAGKGDVGFCGHWTMEIFVIKPVRVYAGMPIGQLTYFETSGQPIQTYDKKKDQKYNHGRQESPRPMPSSMYRNTDGTW